MVARILTVVISALLIALTWGSALRVIRTGRATAERRAGAIVAARADAIAADLDRRLNDSDRLLRFLADRWRGNPSGFDLAGWVRTPLTLPGGAGLFLLNEAGVVRQTTRPGGSGQDPARTEAFAALRQASARQPNPARPLLVIGPAAPDPSTQPEADGAGWHIVLARPLRAATGGFAGAVALALPVRDLLDAAGPTALAPRRVVALVGTGGHVRAVIGRTADVGPGFAPGADMSGVPAVAALRADPAPDARGAGQGQLVPGGKALLFALRRVGGRPLAVLVGVDRAAVLRVPRALVAETRRFALAISALILFVALVVLAEIEVMRRRERRLARDRGALAVANAALAGAKREADAKAALLEGLLAGLPVGVIMFDANLRLVAWNRQVADIAGIPPRLLRVGETFGAMVRAQAEAGEFGPGDPEGQVAKRLARVQSGQGERRTERPRPDGRFVELRRELLPGGGFVTLFTDITERKRAEVALSEARTAAEAATAGKSRLVAMVSHEIRTPLQALLHGTDLLADAPLDPMHHRLLGGMRQAGTAMLRLLEDILDVARMEAGRLALHAERCDPRRPLERAVEMLRPVAAEHGVSLALEVAADVPATVLVDPARLQQVVVNLLSNAAKFSGPGLVRVCAGVAPGPVLLVAVTDQGPAIAPAQRTLLFQPFSRLAPPGEGDASVGAGVGLGLAICRDLVALMGGEIGCAAADLSADATDPAGEAARTGNMFWFTVPLPAAAAAPASGARPAAPTVDGVRARLRILLAEDVAVSRLVTATLLRRDGHAVHPVADGDAAVEAAAHEAFDLVLMDVHLPGRDGVAAARAIRALPGASGAVAILGLTGSVSPEECAACLVAGMGEVLIKPAGPAALRAALARHAGSIRGPAAAFCAAPPAESAVLSEPRLLELQGNLAPATLARVAEECLSGLAELLGRLRGAIAKGDGVAATAAAHAMAGLAGGYGLAALERTVRATLGALRAERLDDAAQHCAGLEADLARAADGLRRALRSEAV